MFSSGRIQIKKRTLPEWAPIFLLLLPFIYSFLVEFIGLPNAIRFISDFLIIASSGVILFKSFSRGVLQIPRVTAVLSSIVTIFFLYTLIAYVFNFQSIFYYIWGVRNNLRFYLAFLIFVSFLKEDDASKCVNFLDVIFWIHFAVTLVQYLGFGYEQDYLGGIFGVQKGCNGYTIAFISIVIARSLLSYMNGNEKGFPCIMKCGAALLISAWAELKIFFFIFILIMTISAVLTRFSVRKFFLMFASFLLVSAAYTVLITLFDGFKGFLSFDTLVNELFKENYASKEDMGRFTSIPTICERFLTTFIEQLGGMGLGNCDTSQVPIFNTAFHDRYAHLHYSIFSVSFMFIETGFIGLTLFTSFFIVCFIRSIKAFRQKEGNMLFNQMGIIMSFLCLILMFYNSSLRTEAGYIVYFALALPYIGLKNKNMHAVADDI